MEPKVELAEDDRPPAELTLDEYLHSSFSPDCDFVDGRTEERNVGKFPHASLLSALLWTLSGKEEHRTWPILPLPSLRLWVAPTRIRIPDISILPRKGPHEQIPTKPPLAVIEILDDEDRFSATMEKLADFNRFGVEHIWLIDPEARSVYRYIDGGLQKVVTDELVVPHAPARVVLSELFDEANRA
jgi:Uma2 family endonuclease